MGCQARGRGTFLYRHASGGQEVYFLGGKQAGQQQPTRQHAGSRVVAEAQHSTNRGGRRRRCTHLLSHLDWSHTAANSTGSEKMESRPRLTTATSESTSSTASYWVRPRARTLSQLRPYLAGRKAKALVLEGSADARSTQLCRMEAAGRVGAAPRTPCLVSAPALLEWGHKAQQSTAAMFTPIPLKQNTPLPAVGPALPLGPTWPRMCWGTPAGPRAAA